jgi:hypothetical protein
VSDCVYFTAYIPLSLVNTTTIPGKGPSETCAALVEPTRLPASRGSYSSFERFAEESGGPKGKVEFSWKSFSHFEPLFEEPKFICCHIPTVTFHAAKLFMTEKSF